MRSPFRRNSRPRDREGRMTVIEHLAELRTRIVRVFAYVALAFVACFWLFEPVVDLISRPYVDAIAHLKHIPPSKVDLSLFGPLDAVALKLKVVTYMAIAVVSPFILLELWGFISPGLTAKERRWARPFLPAALLFFALGVWVGLLTMPKAFEFLLGFAGPKFDYIAEAGKYIGFVAFLLLAFGATFEFPLVMLLLQAANIVTWRQLLTSWRYAMVVIVVAAAVITPSQDPYSLMLMAVPMVVFYFGAILVGRFLFKGRTGAFEDDEDDAQDGTGDVPDTGTAEASL